MTHAPPHRSSAALFMLGAVALFAMMDAGLKSLSAHYPPLQVGAIRGLASFPLVLVWALSTASVRSLVRVHWPMHLLRGALSVLMMAGFVYGVARLPLTTAYAITFAAPLLVTALAGPVLGEHVGPRRWAAVGIGLLGVLVVLRPTGAGMMTLAGGAVLVAACCYAASFLTTRLLARRDSTQAMVLWMVALLGVAAGLLAWPRWVPLQSAHWLQIAIVGVAGAGAQVLLTEAFRRGEASMIAPLEYSALLWGVLLDVALWGVLPDGITWLGAGIIVGSGLYVLYRERVVARAAAATPPP
ncbi:EamA domain-containing membrane protein RarD [Pseudoxanthomonas sp. GM95]|uniref:DMT family transporter n=1 Tax=Pseudoxanthomonas sp. GM95 TaxID=1881043 RepID=UPI0008AFB8E5|nr:DMT family transporter [Pseudoxanthomonas sp. GM95]SEL43693.1 EamA domain-containing membrane protein RarD [Pseudoxanthomonas sp. GM95]